MASATNHSRSRSFARSSGERGWRNARAVAVSCAARLSDPTAVASYSAAPLDRERAGPDRLAGAANDELGLAGQVRLVEREPVGRHHGAVGHHLIAGREADEVPDDDLVQGDAALGPIADHRGVGRDQRREPVEGALRADLLKRTDRDVRDQDPEEERVPPRAEDERQHAEEEQDPVRDRQRVGADDAGVGAARPLAGELAARLEAARGLGLAQPGGRGLGGGRDAPTLSRDRPTQERCPGVRFQPLDPGRR
jgi:hypothetical protein